MTKPGNEESSVESTKESTEESSLEKSDKTRILDRVESVVTETPGVLRIEPSLERLIVEIGATIGEKLGLADQEREQIKTGGVRVNVSDRTVAVSVDIATDQGLPGLKTAQVLQERISDVIKDEGLDSGKVDVNILSVEGR